MKHPSVLVIDDDRDILEALRYTLEDSGYAVLISDTADYVEHLLNARILPDLIILDVLLSGRDGRTICRMLKQNKETANIPVIMMSAHPDVDQSVKQVGANAFLPKPFDLDHLLSQVSRYVPTKH